MYILTADFSEIRVSLGSPDARGDPGLEPPRQIAGLERVLLLDAYYIAMFCIMMAQHCACSWWQQLRPLHRIDSRSLGLSPLYPALMSQDRRLHLEHLSFFFECGRHESLRIWFPCQAKGVYILSMQVGISS